MTRSTNQSCQVYLSQFKISVNIWNQINLQHETASSTNLPSDPGTRSYGHTRGLDEPLAEGSGRLGGAQGVGYGLRSHQDLAPLKLLLQGQLQRQR